MRFLIHFLFLIISVSLFSQNEKRLALVIGNANYDKGELKNPVNDARLIKEKLDSLQFDIIYRENLETNADFKDAVKKFADKRDDYSVAFVYYAGHGIQIDGENFMLPTKEIFEKENDVKFSAVSVQDIMMWLKDKTDEVNVLVLDACRNNPYENSFETVRSYGGKSRGLARMSSAGSLIAFSTEPGKVAADGEGENSYYTISLAKNMMLKDTSLDQVFRNVNAEVMEYSGKIQNPIVASQLTGQEFFLNPTDINNLLDEIQDLISDEKYDEARSRIEPIVAQHPQNTRALQKRAEIFYYVNNYSRSIDEINSLMGISLNNDRLYRLRAANFLEINEYQKAEADYTKAIELDPENDENYYQRGYFYIYYLEDNDKAIADFTKAIELDPLDPYNYYQRGYTFGENEQYNEALASYLKAEELDKDKSLAKSEALYNNMAIVFENLNQNDKAIEYYTKEIEISPDYFLGYSNRALRYAVDLKDYEKAEADYTKAIELDPENDKNYSYRGNFYRNYLEDNEKAIADYTKVIELDPNAKNFYNRAEFRYDLENYELAISDYLRALELDIDQKISKDEYLLNGLAMAYKQLGNLDSAIIYLEKEIELNPFKKGVYRNLGDIYVELRQFDKAREIYDNLINVDSKNAQNYVVRAQFFMTDIDDYSSSISDLSKAIELEIDNSDFYFTRAQVYFKTKEYKSALNDFQKALELNPEIINSKYIYAEIAKCHAGIGDFEKALDYYNMEIDLGENANAYSERGMFYDLYLNDFEKANLDFEKAIELAPNTNNIVLQYLNFLHYNKKYKQALEIAKKASEIEPKDPQSAYVSASIYMEINKPFQALAHLNSCIEKIIKFYGEGYWISDRSNSELDLSEVFLMRGNFYKDKDKELMCNDYEEALNFTFDENQKAKINSLLSENCGT